MSHPEEERVTRQPEETPAREKERKARDKLALLLRRLRERCEQMDQVSDWEEIVADVDEVLHAHRDVIGRGRRRRIRRVLRVPRAGVAGLKQGCRALQSEVEQAIGDLVPVPVVAGTLSAVVIAIAVGVVLLTTASHIAAVDLYVENRGCGDLPVAATIEAYTGLDAVDHPLLNLLGIALPAVIEDDTSEVISLPPLRLDLDNETHPGELRIHALGQALPVPLGAPTALSFDGVSLLGQRTPIRLQPLGEYDLTITCEE